jgi:hypothetical protein
MRRMAVTVGGRRLGVAENGRFTAENTDPIPGGRLWPEAALTWNAMRAAYVADGGRAADFAPAGPVSSARPRLAQDYFWKHQPPAAARPYTSNHGWGLAVDVATRACAAWIMAHGATHGWSHAEGLRVGEWWHMAYVGAPRVLLLRLARDPLAGFTRSERRWVREWDRGPSPTRRLELRRAMVEQRKRIWRAAQGDGWTWDRRRRYRALLSRTT